MQVICAETVKIGFTNINNDRYINTVNLFVAVYFDINMINIFKMNGHISCHELKPVRILSKRVKEKT